MNMQREVRCFGSLPDAERDALDRGECIVMTNAGWTWSVPLELNVHEVTVHTKAALAGVTAALKRAWHAEQAQ